MASIRDLMTTNVCTVDRNTTLVDAARVMRENDIGDVVVINGDQLAGIITDRDIVVRALAEGMDPSSCTVGEVCSGDVTTIGPELSVQEAARVMRQHDVRRLPVVEGGRPVGMVSLGDLAIESDPQSALADISAAPGNT